MALKAQCLLGFWLFIECPEAVIEAVEAFSLLLACELKVVQKEPFENLKPFKKARLYKPTDSNGRWYIIFYAWDVKQNQLVRKRDYSINEYKSTDEKVAFAKDRIKQINALLEKGYHIDEAKQQRQELIPRNKVLPIGEVLFKMLEIKLPVLRPRTKSSYRHAAKDFLSFLDSISKSSYSPSSISKQDIINYSDHLLTEKRVGPKTRNNYLTYLRSLFSEMVHREFIEQNPLSNVKDLAVTISTRNRAFDQSHINILKEEIPNVDTDLWHFVQFIYYCYIRPAEIVRLKIKHIFLKQNKIFVPAEISKNKKSEYVSIPTTLRGTISKMNLEQFPETYHIFSKTGKPGTEKMRDNEMTKRHRKILDGLDFDKDFTLYSWKHTGNVRAYKAGIDIKSIQRQNRHHSLDMTDKYLKSLGLDENKEMILQFPDL